ncbi:MAG: NAD(P)H-hydrate dehydratase [Halobacteriota archaeon]
MISADRMVAVDANAEALGVPRKQLMESSGNAVASVLGDIAPPGSRVVVVCGRGNNGGDAMVAVRFLTAYETETVLLGRPTSIATSIARENWEALVAAEVPTRTITDSAAFGSVDLESADVVVDAMLGTGVTGALREPEATAARTINRSDATVVSVDVPSGVDADTGDAAGVAVEADHVVTFHDSKRGLESIDAAVTVADIGIPEAATLFVGPGDVRAESRRSESHKGDHGSVLVVGGGPYTGAPTLSARAALRAGADLVRVATPLEVAREVQGFSENLIVRPFEGDRLTSAHLDHVRSLADDHDVVVFGPGLGDHPDTLSAVRTFLASFDGRAVVDADALSVVAEIETDATIVCTPHQGELRKMGGQTADGWRERAELVADFAEEIGHTLLVKGAYDVIADGETVRVNRTGNPGMTVGGTGDVLAGVTGALCCLYDPLQAAAIAAYVNGRAGDRAFDEHGNGLVATDLIDRLPEARRTDA